MVLTEQQLLTTEQGVKDSPGLSWDCHLPPAPGGIASHSQHGSGAGFQSLSLLIQGHEALENPSILSKKLKKKGKFLKLYW